MFNREVDIRRQHNVFVVFAASSGLLAALGTLWAALGALLAAFEWFLGSSWAGPGLAQVTSGQVKKSSKSSDIDYYFYSGPLY